MGEFTDGSSPEQEAMDARVATSNEPGEIKTDVEGIFADGTKNDLPVFDVSDKDFYSNMNINRKRMRFSSDSNVSKYMKGTKYNRPFWIRSNTDNGSFIRKVK